jgi:alkanesulfonate monooxygenase
MKLIQFGLGIKNFVGPSEAPDIDQLIAYAERAEQLGYESLWAWDHILLGVEPAFPILDSLVTLAALATRTSRIKLATGVLVLPMRNPTVVAKQLASIDQVSKGRLIVGVAAGWYKREFDAVGIPFERRGRIMDRNLDILKRLWTEDQVTLQADEINLRQAVQVPRPYQRPQPPIVVGGYVDAVLKRVARVGDGWLTYFYTVDSFKRNWAKIQTYAREYGRDPASITATNQLAIYVGESREEVEGPMRHWLTTEWDTASWSESTIEHAIMGSVDDCVEQLRPHVEAGLDRIVLLPYRYDLEQVELIAREILPKLMGERRSA